MSSLEVVLRLIGLILDMVDESTAGSLLSLESAKRANEKADELERKKFGD